MTRTPISDEQIISDAVRLVSEGLAVTLLVKGRSMLPFILGGQDSAVLTRPGELRPGDVVLARIDGRRYVLHRIIEVTADRIVLMGDGNIRGQEICRPEDVLARADEIVAADGTHRRLDTPKALRRARLWRRLLPVRRWLLAIYKRTIIRNIPIQ
jgi:hypothetical protein